MLLSIIFLVCWHPAVFYPQFHERQLTSLAQPAARSSLTGVYRIDIPASDRLYSVVAGASSNLPFGEQQRFFIDLAVRLTPPDLLAIERQGTRISLGSSRAPRMTFVADGVVHDTRAADGHLIHVRLSLQRTGENERVIFTSSGRSEDNFSVEFETFDNGTRLRVVRRISAEGLDRPLVIRTVYNKISEIARWELYGESQVAIASQTPSSTAPLISSATKPNPSGRTINTPAADPAAASVLRDALNAWIAATNNRDINQQMSFYVARLKRFYLMSNAARSFVREEKARVFANASVIDIRAEEPEIIFQDGGRRAVMRYRKQYRIENGRNSRRGEVIQELRWQRVGTEWRIFSERDIKVLR